MNIKLEQSQTDSTDNSNQLTTIVLLIKNEILSINVLFN